MLFTVLDENEENIETVIDFDEIACFNERIILLKNGLRIPSCKKWHNHLKLLKKYRRKNEKRNAAKKI